MGFDIGALIGGGVSAIFENQFMEEDRNQRQQFAVGQSREAMDFSERMANTQYQRQVADMKAAGLNPALAYLHGGNSSAAGVAASPSGGTSGANPRMSEAVMMQSQIDVNSAQAEKLRAEAQATRGETLPSQVSMQHMRQQIDESIERIGQIVATAHREWASAEELRQRVNNLRETVPQIRATVEQLKAFTTKAGVETQRVTEETREIRQRVAANLPALQAALAQLDQYGKQLDLPRREQESAAHDRFVGALGAIMRILNPLSGLIGR